MVPDTGIEKGPQAGRVTAQGPVTVYGAASRGLGSRPRRQGKPLQAEMFLITTSCQSSQLVPFGASELEPPRQPALSS